MPCKNYQACMNENIIRFIQKQTCTTLCCVDDQGNSWCFSCFYAFNSREVLLYFKSPDDTYHSTLIKKNPGVAGTILPDKLNKLSTKGIQLVGEILQQQHLLAKNAYMNYHKKYPMALALPGDMFTVRINYIKMSETLLGVIKKSLWNRAATDMME
jgi:hypothetical protein